MEGKGENKGTKRRPNTEMEQPEEKWREGETGVKSSSEILQDLLLGFFFSSQRSTQTRQ